LYKGTSIKIKIFTPNELTDQEKKITIKKNARESFGRTQRDFEYYEKN